MKKFNQIIPGDIIFVDADYGDIHEFLVKFVENNAENGRTLYGTDLSCLSIGLEAAESRFLCGYDIAEDYETEEYIGSVTEDRFVGEKEFPARTCKIVLCEGEPEEEQILCLLPDAIADYIRHNTDTAKECLIKLGDKICDIGIIDRIIYPEPKPKFKKNEISTLMFSGKEFRRIVKNLGYIITFDYEGFWFYPADYEDDGKSDAEIVALIGDELGVKVTSIHKQEICDEDGECFESVWVAYEKQEVRL